MDVREIGEVEVACNERETNVWWWDVLVHCSEGGVNPAWWPLGWKVEVDHCVEVVVGEYVGDECTSGDNDGGPYVVVVGEPFGVDTGEESSMCVGVGL